MIIRPRNRARSLKTKLTGPVFPGPEIGNNILWLDGNDPSTITASLDVVSQWRDKSGNNYHVAQASEPGKPMTNQHSYNGRNGITFANFDKGLSRANTDVSIAMAGVGTIYVVSQHFTYKNFNDLVVGFNVFADHYILYNNSGANIAVRHGANVQTRLTTPDALPHIIGQRYDGTNLYLLFDSTTSAAVAGSNIGTGNLLIGNDGALNLGINGVIFEVIMFNKALSTPEHNLMLAYLKANYNI